MLAAVISYRVIPGEDGFSLDAQAFTSALQAAESAGIAFLWLDVRALPTRALAIRRWSIAHVRWAHAA